MVRGDPTPALSRRGVVLGVGALVGLALPPWRAGAEMADEPQPFAFERLVERARELAREPYAPPPQVPPALAELGYEQYRQIRFRPERAFWADRPGYRLELFHTGSYYREAVRIHLVENGMAREIAYSPELFDFGPITPPADLPPEMGIAGVRIRYPLNEPDRLDDLLVFLGASYFRALGRGTHYGISARGLALETGLGKPEEFPRFSQLWLERPAEASAPLVAYALLEGPSVVGAYRLDVAARERTDMDVDASLFFRQDVEQVGIAPLTSMYYFGASDRVGVDDWRAQVHDSQGLAVWRGSGELSWRPLANPSHLRLSVFVDDNPRGFGLLQRDRRFASYEDLEARYDLRPSLWVEPKGAWGRGSVRLIEIPTPDETHDNIVAFWTPEAPVTAGQELRFAYRLIWSLEPPLALGLAEVIGTRIGVAGGPTAPERLADWRRIVIDFGPPAIDGLPADMSPEVTLECQNATCSPALLERNDVTGGWRVRFDVRPEAEDAVELRCILTQAGRHISETWLYRIDGAQPR